MKNIPYTYLIGWTKMGKWYYGCRYAKKCHPKELWVSYHTSSKYVKQMRKEFGEPDVVQVRKTFSDGDARRSWEEKVIRRMKCVKSENWLNKANAGKEWNTAGQINSTVFKPGKDHIGYGLPAWNRGINSLPEKEIRRRSEQYRGAGNPNYGKVHTEAALEKMRASRANVNPHGRHAVPHTKETKDVIRAKALAQSARGEMPYQIKISCIVCRGETNLAWFSRKHSMCHKGIQEMIDLNPDS